MAQTSAYVSSPALLPPASPLAWWGRLLHAGRLAIAPSRVLTAFFLLVVLGALIRVPDLFAAYGSDGIANTPVPSDLAAACAEVMSEQLAGHRFIDAAQTMIVTPVALVRAHPQWTLALLLPTCILWGLLGGAISRGATVEFATGAKPTWSQTMGHAMSRWHSVALATLGPLLIVGMLLALLPVLGKLLDVKFVQYAAGVLYVVPMLLSFIATALVIVFIISLPMLVAGVMSEGGEAIEACQRAFAYVLAQPLRFGGAMLVLAGVGVGLLAVFAVFTQLALYTSSQLSTLWVSDSARDLLQSQMTTGQAPALANPTTGLAITGMLVGFWTKLALMIAPSVFLSFVFCAGSVLYLSMRQVVDGQHPRDIWDPTRGSRALVPATTDADASDEDES